MLYHARALASNDVEVELVGFEGTPLPKSITGDSRIRVHRLNPATLRAFRASDVRKEIYNSDTNSTRDAPGAFTKFAPPVVADGKVYVPTQTKAVGVYGLLCGRDVSPLVRVNTGTAASGPDNSHTQSITVTNT